MTEPTPVVGDLYATLGVARDATSEDIKKAFRQRARECHPDVAGDDPAAAKRFDKVRKAYEVLVDPVKRAAYERGPRRRVGRRTRSTDGYRMPGGLYTRHNFGGGRTAASPNARARQRNEANNISLDDLMGDFGFGGAKGGGARPNAGAYGGSGRTEQARQGTGRSSGGDTPPQRDLPGRDITMVVDVPADVAERGGVVTLQYPRMRRTEDGRGVARYDEIHDLRVPPGTRNGEVLSSRNYGDAGTDGSHGDLVCEVRVVGASRVEPGPGPRPGPRPGSRPEPRPSAPRSKGTRTSGPRSAPPPAAGPAAEPDAAIVLPISLTEALLGGRVPIDTPQGRVFLTLRPGTGEGTRLRLRGKAADGGDLYVSPRIVLPRELDDESVALIERFAELNPYDPRA
jgi:DnaJ-class molecular chaperone